MDGSSLADNPRLCRLSSRDAVICRPFHRTHRHLGHPSRLGSLLCRTQERPCRHQWRRIALRPDDLRHGGKRTLAAAANPDRAPPQHQATRTFLARAGQHQLGRELEPLQPPLAQRALHPRHRPDGLCARPPPFHLGLDRTPRRPALPRLLRHLPLRPRLSHLRAGDLLAFSPDLCSARRITRGAAR